MTTTLNFKQFLTVAPAVLRSRKPLMGRGRHGVGKSQVVYQIAKRMAQILGLEDKLGAGYEFPVVERRLSQIGDVGDFLGLPRVETGDFGPETQFTPPEWFLKACNEPVVLFFDEVDRAPTDVRQTAMELTDSRKLFGRHLHPDTIIIAMVNGGEHDEGNNYQVGELDPAEADRWWVCNVEPTVGDWVDFMTGAGASPILVDFIRQNPNHLEHKGDFEAHKVYPSRRSWTQFEKALALSAEAGQDFLGAAGGEVDMTLFHLGAGFVGTEAAIAFRDFVENYAVQIAPEDIFAGRKIDLVEKASIVEVSALVDKVCEHKSVTENKLSDEEVKNLAAFGRAISAELLMKFWSKLTSASQDCMVRLFKSEDENGQSFSKFFREAQGL